jgi:hypothetical protein
VAATLGIRQACIELRSPLTFVVNDSGPRFQLYDDRLAVLR